MIFCFGVFWVSISFFCTHDSIFDELLEQPGDPKWLDDIRKDLHPQFPNHEMFTESDGPGYTTINFFNSFIRWKLDFFVIVTLTN